MTTKIYTWWNSQNLLATKALPACGEATIVSNEQSLHIFSRPWHMQGTSPWFHQNSETHQFTTLSHLWSMQQKTSSRHCDPCNTRSDNVEDTKTVRELILSPILIPVTNSNSLSIHSAGLLLASDVSMTGLHVYGHCLWMQNGTVSCHLYWSTTSH